MLKISEIQNVQVLCPEMNSEIESGMIFDDLVIEFFDRLSKTLLSNHQIREYPDIATLSFWLRKANLTTIKNQFNVTYKNIILLPRGIVFHIAPSNVDTIFMYSMAISILAGNANIVRVSEKSSIRVSIIIREMNKLLNSEQYQRLKNYILIVSYGHDDKLNEYFSLMSDVRIIWGGNETVNRIRKIPSKPRCIDLPFVDRYSFAVFDAKKLLEDKDLHLVCSKFYNDSYTFDQNACSSPRMVIWLGDEKTVNESRNIFWMELEKIVTLRYHLQPASAIEKLISAFGLSIEKGDTKIAKENSNSIVRVEVENLGTEVRTFSCAAGFFTETRINKLDDLIEFISDCDQTMTTFGISKDNLKEFLLNKKLRGIDRVVELGHALDFNEKWDGYDLIRILTREATIY